MTARSKPGSGRRAADLGGRLRRVLLMIPWLLDEGGSTVEAIAARFGIAEKDVVSDLELVMCCGVPPYGGGDMIDVVLDDDGTVYAFKGPFFTRPMQLTPAEGFTVLAAGRALEAVPGPAQREALTSALAKLEAALGAPGALAVELESPALLDVVRRAVERGERLAITYYAAGRDEISDRVVEPLLVHSRDGRWYVETIDVTAGDEHRRERRLRVDRIRRAEPTGETFERPAAPPAPPETLYAPGPDAVEVTVELPASAPWVGDWVEVVERTEPVDGRYRVRFFLEGERLLERLLLRVGPEAVVVSPPGLASLGRRAAERVLARYQQEPSAS